MGPSAAVAPDPATVGLMVLSVVTSDNFVTNRPPTKKASLTFTLKSLAGFLAIVTV